MVFWPMASMVKSSEIFFLKWWYATYTWAQLLPHCPGPAYVRHFVQRWTKNQTLESTLLIKIFDFSNFFFIFSNHLVIVVYGPNFSHLTPSTWPQEQKEDPKKVLSKKGKNFSNFSSSAPGPLRAQLWYLWAMLHLMVGPHPIWAKSEICPVLTG